MGYRTPAETAVAAVDTGAAKATLPLPKMLVGGFLAGAYIAFGGLVAMAVSSGLDPKTWGTLPTLFTGATFALGLVLVVLAGSELLTGNMMLVPLAALSRRVGGGRLAMNLAVITIANLIGSVFVAYFLAVKSGVIGTAASDPATTAGMIFKRLAGIATSKAVTESDWQIFLRAVGCNWLVCLAVWLAIAADDMAGKILGIFFPILAFVAIGFDHVVANMFFLPAAMFAHVPGIGWGHVVNNWVWAFLGNLVGAGLFVAVAYHYQYLAGSRRAPASGSPYGDRVPVIDEEAAAVGGQG